MDSPTTLLLDELPQLQAVPRLVRHRSLPAPLTTKTRFAKCVERGSLLIQGEGLQLRFKRPGLIDNQVAIRNCKMSFIGGIGLAKCLPTGTPDKLARLSCQAPLRAASLVDLDWAIKGLESPDLKEEAAALSARSAG